MRRSTVLLAAVSLAALVAAAPVLAQDHPGVLSEGALTDEDAREDGVPYDAYPFEGRAGQRFEAAMTSAEFDAYLELRDASGELIGSNDDSGGDGQTDSRLRFTLPETGAYELRARGFGEDARGAYVVTMAERPPAPPAPRPGGLRVGQTISGELTDRDPETDVGARYDAYRIRARAGERIAFSLDSDAFDPIIFVGRQDGAVFEELASNDDGDELNSRLTFTAPASGDFIVRVSEVGGDAGGAYRLRAERAPDRPSAQQLQPGADISGELTEEDRTGSDAPADRYTLRATEGQRLRIEMSSSAFDTFLELFDGNGQSVASDDDGMGEGTNSRLTHTFDRAGEYELQARAFSDGTGAYTLSVSEVAPPPPARPLAFGATIESAIGDDDSTDEADRHYEDYGFSGSEGQRVQAVMRSGDFDTYLQISSADGEFSVLAEDDDGLGEGTDSRLNFTLPSDGDYVLRASPLGSEEEGLFSLELINRGANPTAGSILVGATARGTLSETDATADDNSFYDAYRVRVAEGEKLRIVMVSNELDSFLVLGRITDGEFQILESDDDGLSDTHAKLDWTASDAGTYEIRAGSFQQGETGAYALSVEKQAQAAAEGDAAN